ncbi:MAG: SAM-dependent methyltransferase, partial [Hyphomicrobiales bacterium]
VLEMDFRELAFEKPFDGIWAAASLLHVPWPALPDVFNRIARSLRPGGYFTASFKESDVDWRDELGRTFCAMNAKKLEKYVTDAGLNPLSIDRENGFGSDKQPTQWLWVTAQAV